MISGNLRCPQDYGWHGSSWGGRSPEWSLAGPGEVIRRPSAGSISEACAGLWHRKTPPGQGRLLSTQACGARCPRAGCESAQAPPGVGVHSSDLRGRARPEVGTAGVSRQCRTLQGPPCSKTAVPEPPMPDLGGPLGSDSGKPFSESYLGDLPGNGSDPIALPTLRWVPGCDLLGWLGSCVHSQEVPTLIPEVGGAGDRPVPAPRPSSMGGQAPGGTLWTLVLQSRVFFTISGCT